MTVGPVDAPGSLPDAPYKGLASFTENDAPFFFGRSAERKILLASLRSARLTLLYGVSGVGKSSLLQAGFAPYVRAIARENLQNHSTPEIAVATVSAWVDNPRRQVDDAVARAVQEAWGKELERPADDLPLAKALQVWSDRLDGALFVLFDQFEDYLARPDLAFDDELAEAFDSSDARVSFLLSVQEEAFARLDRFEQLVPQLFSNAIRLEHLDRDAARDAILCPIGEWNQIRNLSAKSRYVVEDELVDDILDQPEFGIAAPSHHQMETAYLQLILRRLWDEEVRRGSRRLRLDTLVELGGPSKIVDGHIDKVLGSVPQEDRAATARVLRYFVAPFGEKGRVTSEQLSYLSGLAPAAVDKAIDQLSGGMVRILRRTVDARGEVQYETFHDLLVPALFQWVEGVEKEVAEAELRAQSRLAERERRRSYVLSAALILAVVGLLAAAFSYYRALAEARHAERQERRALARTLELQAERLRSQSFDLAALLGVEAYDIDRDVQALDRLREALSGKSALGTFVGWATGGVESVTCARDGKTVTVATASELRILTRAGRMAPFTVSTWRIDSGRIAHASFNRDGTMLAVLGSDGIVRLWSIDRSGPFPGDAFGATNPLLTTIAISSNAQLVATGGSDRAIHVWSVAEKRELWEIRLPMRGSVQTLDFSPDDRMIAVGGSDGTVLLVPLGGASVLLRGSGAAVHCAVFSPDGRMIAAGGARGTLEVWSVSTRQRLFPAITTGGGAIRSVVFDPDGQIVAAGNDEGVLGLWSVFSGDPLGPVRQGHARAMNCLVFAPDGRSVISGQDDGSIRRWDVLVLDVESRRAQMAGPASVRQCACALANRNLSRDEWTRFFGPDTPYRTTCPELIPSPGKVPVLSGSHVSERN